MTRLTTMVAMPASTSPQGHRVVSPGNAATVPGGTVGPAATTPAVKECIAAPQTADVERPTRTPLLRHSQLEYGAVFLGLQTKNQAKHGRKRVAVAARSLHVVCDLCECLQRVNNVQDGFR